jgi:hypothetical protein
MLIETSNRFPTPIDDMEDLFGDKERTNQALVYYQKSVQNHFYDVYAFYHEYENDDEKGILGQQTFKNRQQVRSSYESA